MKILFLITIMFFSTNIFAKFTCKGEYDKYDDTCYLEDGTFKHYNFVDGKREVREKERGFGFYGWRNGYYAGFTPYYWYYPRGNSRYAPDGVRRRRVHGRDERRRSQRR